MKILVQFSGGKDSQACLISAVREFGKDQVTAVFCDTGWEHELTYKHINDVVADLGVELLTLRNASVDGMAGLCRRMKWFPDTQHRMCTVQLKIYPTIDYVLSLDDDVMIIQGIRAAESASRSMLACSDDYFKEYNNPTPPEGKKPKELYQKRKVREWCKHHRAIVERPFFGASGQEIIDYILEAGQQPNPLYRRGCSRVGCFPCIYAKLAELRVMAKDKPYVERLVRLEHEVNTLRGTVDKTPSSFFPKGKIPARFCRTYGNGVATFEEILAYATREDDVPDLFEPEGGYSCMSMYHGLCE